MFNKISKLDIYKICCFLNMSIATTSTICNKQEKFFNKISIRSIFKFINESVKN